MNTKQLPDGLQLAVNALEWHSACCDEYKVEIDAIHAEHAQRLTLQHRAADQAQRIADLEAHLCERVVRARDELKDRRRQDFSNLALLSGALAEARDEHGKLLRRIADLETKCDTLKRLHDAATAERDKLRTKVADLERAAVKRREISDDVEAELADECDTLRIVNRKVEAERDELRARLAEIEGQEPVDVQVRVNNPLCTWQRPDTTHDEPTILARAQYLCSNWPKQYSMRLLYARPIPAIPDGWRLVPAEPTQEMLAAAARASMRHLIDCINDPARAAEVGSEEMCKRTHGERYRSMLAAAPEAAR